MAERHVPTGHLEKPATQPVLVCSTKFYFEDLYLRVENTLFKVLRREFESASEVFRDMFKLPTGNRKAEDEMEHFLGALYPQPPSIYENKREDPPLKSVEQWMAIFRLSALWNFAALKDEAINGLQDTDPITRVHIHDRFMGCLPEPSRWLVCAIEELVRRPGELTEIEVEQIGIQRSLRICTLRGEYRAFHPFKQHPCAKLLDEIGARFIEAQAGGEPGQNDEGNEYRLCLTKPSSPYYCPGRNCWPARASKRYYVQ